MLQLAREVEDLFALLYLLHFFLIFKQRHSLIRVKRFLGGTSQLRFDVFVPGSRWVPADTVVDAKNV